MVHLLDNFPTMTNSQQNVNKKCALTKSTYRNAIFIQRQWSQAMNDWSEVREHAVLKLMAASTISQQVKDAWNWLQVKLSRSSLSWRFPASPINSQEMSVTREFLQKTSWLFFSSTSLQAVVHNEFALSQGVSRTSKIFDALFSSFVKWTSAEATADVPKRRWLLRCFSTIASKAFMYSIAERRVSTCLCK